MKRIYSQTFSAFSPNNAGDLVTQPVQFDVMCSTEAPNQELSLVPQNDATITLAWTSLGQRRREAPQVLDVQSHLQGDESSPAGSGSGEERRFHSPSAPLASFTTSETLKEVELTAIPGVGRVIKLTDWLFP